MQYSEIYTILRNALKRFGGKICFRLKKSKEKNNETFIRTIYELQIITWVYVSVSNMAQSVLADILKCTGDELICENVLGKLLIHQYGSIVETSIMTSKNSHFPSFMLNGGRRYGFHILNSTPTRFRLNFTTCLLPSVAL